MKLLLKINLLFLFLLTIIAERGFTQISTSELAGQVNTITTAVPFLLIAPDARAGGMGDGGVSSLPDVFSNHWNASKFAFIEKNMGFGISYSPWLRALVPDINLAYLSVYKRLDKMQTLSASLLYFSLGDITFTDVVGNVTGQYRPNEFAVDIAYSRKLSEDLSGGITFRYIYSNLTSGQFVGSQSTHAGQSVAADISSYYHKEITIGNQDAVFAAGINISNIGAKISYTESAERDFIPINLKLGPSLLMNLDDYNTISFLFDVNKLLVPTPNPDSITHRLPDVSIVNGMFNSFSDAPGGGKEELHEIIYSVGLEYWYDKQFAIRGGYFYEHPTKGNRQFFTLGAGIKYSVFGLDFAYLIPASSDVKSPLANTLRFSLTFDFEAFKEQNNNENK
ncbi:MAG: type IX secretion system outer membrane channel protein PorV [Bacteroidales bacterium]|nr:type IX secretion system outer membrane channel protein PorV [Bacteroidales bacterium]